jgi:hypothetical protein
MVVDNQDFKKMISEGKVIQLQALASILKRVDKLDLMRSHWA